MIHLDHRDRRPIYEQALEAIRQQIRAGVLLPGEQLPSVRELSAMLSVNPNTIQRSYRELEMQGWIATVPGKGCFVCGTPILLADDHSSVWEDFDKAAARLLALGISREDMCRRLKQGGNEHA